MWLYERPRAILMDPPGLGKTAQAITAAHMVGGDRNVVICPAVAVSNWRKEWRMWWPDSVPPTVVSYDRVARSQALRRELARIGMDCLILDEAHYLKSRAALRTRRIYHTVNPDKGLTARARHCWGLSGTLAPNSVLEYWTHFRTLAPHLITQPGSDRPMGFNEFLMQYTTWTAGPYGPQVHQTRNKEQLRSILGQLGLRRRVEDVLPELPPLVWGEVAVDADEARTEIDRLEQSPEAIELREHLAAGSDFLSSTLHLATLRRLVGAAKAVPVARMVEDELESGAYEKIIIWAWHRDVCETLVARLTKFGVATITGSTPTNHRLAIVNEFQQNPRVRVFVGQIQAAGTAITLTAADQVLFCESSWVPEDMTQAAARAHRFGQTRPVFARIAYLSDSTDELVANAHTKKLRNQVLIGESK